MKKKIKIKKILDFLKEENIEYDFEGNDEDIIEGFSSLKNYRKGTITWVKNYNHDLEMLSIAPRLVVAQKGVDVFSENCIETEVSKKAFFKILEKFWESKCSGEKIGKSTYLSDEVELGSNCIIGSNSVLDGNIRIGANSVIGHNVTILGNVDIGERCIIQSGTVVGHDGYSYTENGDGKKEMIKHYGGVSIGNDVFIGSNTCIVRGTIDDTIISEGCKIDNLCHIAHNVILEKNVSLVAGSLIYGSVHIDENAYVASAIVKNQHYIGKNSTLGMGCVVITDVKSGKVVAGIPATELIK